MTAAPNTIAPASTFGSRLRAAMEARGRSSNWLATHTRITRRWICRLRADRAKSGPSPYVVAQFARALGCSPSWLLFGEGSMTREEG